MNWRVFVGLGAVAAAITVGMWWNRTESQASSALVIRRIAPTDLVLRGSPNEPVQVELELTNTTRQAMELAPLHMSCSCQIAKWADKSIAAGGTSRVALSLRYPVARSSLTPVEFKTPSGELLARTDIALEVDLQVPYFVDCPELVEISIIEGVSDRTWSARASTVELSKQPPYVKGVRVTEGGEYVRAALTNSEHSYPGVAECQRTFQLTFQMQDATLSTFSADVPLRGVAVLELQDGSEQAIPWAITRKAPLALVFDSPSGSVRGIRRVGAQGAVTLHCVPAGSGTLTPDRFDTGQSIVANWNREPRSRKLWKPAIRAQPPSFLSHS